MAMENLKELFEHELKDMYFAEKHLVAALDKSAKEATDPELKEAFSSHMKETKDHCERIEKVFKMMDKSPRAATCDGVMGLLKEKEGFKKEKPSSEIKDLFDATAAIKVERYEISGYEALIRMARELGMDSAADLFEKTLEEERTALQTLESFSEDYDLTALAAMSEA